MSIIIQMQEEINRSHERIRDLEESCAALQKRNRDLSDQLVTLKDNYEHVQGELDEYRQLQGMRLARNQDVDRCEG